MKGVSVRCLKTLADYLGLVKSCKSHSRHLCQPTRPYFHFVYLGSDRYYIPGEGVLEGNILKYTKCEGGRNTGLAFYVKVVNLYYD